jgi:hypothetical protein
MELPMPVSTGADSDELDLFRGMLSVMMKKRCWRTTGGQAEERMIEWGGGNHGGGKRIKRRCISILLVQVVMSVIDDYY